MKLRIIPHKRENAAWNLALEEALFIKSKERLLKGLPVQPIVKLYSFDKPSVILGYQQKISEIDHEFCEENKINVTMRTTGGGSVYLGRKDLQYSLILPTNYSLELLKKINTSIVHSLQDVGLSPNLALKDNHSIIRIKNKGSIFDAQRRFKNLILHHGTTLVDNYDYEDMPRALKATPEEIEILQKGNLWLNQEINTRENQLIKAFEKNLPENSSVIRKDFTNEEINLAKELYKNFYTNKKEFTSGKKNFGICYKTDTPYDMEQYTIKDKNV